MMKTFARRFCVAGPLPAKQRFATVSLQQQRHSSTGIRRFKLNTGAEIPAIGFGTFHGEGDVAQAVADNIDAGMRLIDTARVCGVEKEVGEGIKRSSVPREEIFLGTKLWCNDFHPADVEAALDESLSLLNTSYVDLLMMHYPVSFRRGRDHFPRDASGNMIRGDTPFVETWRVMEKLLQTGKVKALGISNFSKAELETLMRATSVVPAVHQLEGHPYLQQKEYNQWLKSKGIHVIQFSPLGNMNNFYRETGWSKKISHMVRVINHPVLQSIGKKYGKSAVQVALAWAVNSGRSVIPMATIDWQIKENVEADFELAPEDMKAIGELDIKARFNDPSLDYQWQLYSDLDGIEGRKDGKTH